jgi:hypothetical protein
MRMLKSLIAIAAMTMSLWASGQSPSVNWNGVHTFSSASTTQQKLSQADLIAKREAGYYDNIGKTIVSNYVFSSNTVGSITENTTNVSIVGDGVSNIVQESSNTGNLDGSIRWSTTSNSQVDGEVR